MLPPALTLLLLLGCLAAGSGTLSQDGTPAGETIPAGLASKATEELAEIYQGASTSAAAVASDTESQPTTSDETVVAGGTVVLKCKVEDPDDSSLQWSNPAQQTLYFGEKRALRDNRIQLVKSTPNELAISISNVVLADEGEYTCSIFTMPVRTAKALVTVLGIPQNPQIFGYELPIRETETAQLTCRSSGSKPAAQLRWKKGNKELQGGAPEVMEDSNGKTFTVTSHVEFTVTKEDNDVEVTCTVDHESLQNSERSTSQKLQVHFKPTATIEPDPLYPREGEELRLQCEAQGNPIPQEFLWTKEGSDVPLNLNTNRVLTLPFLNKSDSGTYICMATSTMGSVVVRYNLDINDASPMSSSSGTYHAVVGGVVAVIVFLLLSLLIVLAHYLIRHKGTYLTHEAKGSDDAPDADTAIINAEGGQASGDDKKEYFI
ncbi:cell adhesion molecule 3 isoform X3 [Terrapene carolina triunguis]|uniref:cell adhesion molecule 3 isoform X3 n=1 Tax=Terrapene triunguis TaxID=2587831 RepID=UPI000E774082|nr:cell adhesion molecule 3 isoform X3 [Terrapene carolina triunguis]